MISKPPLILLVGPTASGKTEISIELAERLGAEIISADSRLFYRGMDIGTAKPTPADRARVPHHLIDIANPDETLSLAIFQQLARQAISDILHRGLLPMLVGGTGQYVRAVIGGWRPPSVAANSTLRAGLERMNREHGGEWLHERLKRLDIKAAEGIDPRNVRRTMRALEVILISGRRFSEQRGQLGASYHLIGIGLSRPRAELYARIDARIDHMFEAGLVEETQGLLTRGYAPELPAMSAIGYRECIKVINREIDVEQAKVLMRRATRAFVRRQSNWFKENDPNIAWFSAADHDVVAATESLIRSAIGK